MPGEDFHLSDQTRFQAHLTPAFAGWMCAKIGVMTSLTVGLLPMSSRRFLNFDCADLDYLQQHNR